MIIERAFVYDAGDDVKEPSFSLASVRVEGSLIKEVSLNDIKPFPGEEVFSGSGLYLIPGLIDLHIHGFYGNSCSSADLSSLVSLGRALARCGVTGYLPTFSAMPLDRLERAISTYLPLIDTYDASQGARPFGFHLEGPFLNPEKKGAMDRAYLRLPSQEDLDLFCSWTHGKLRILTLAPELSGALLLIRSAALRGVNISLGHTNATETEARAAVQAGARRVTHTYNAMRALNHREPGILGAALTESSLQCELIADLVHVNETACRILYACKGYRRVTLVSDACDLAGLSAEDLPEDLPYILRDAAYLKDGTLCGSTGSVMRGVRNMIKLNVSPAKAVYMASTAPAKELGLEDRLGVIQAGAFADLVLLSRDLEIQRVFLSGKPYALI